MKKLALIIMLFLSVFLYGCWEKKENNLQTIKFWEFQLDIPKNYMLVNTEKKYSWKYTILYEYKESSFSGFSDSIIIAEYKWKINDQKKFFSIIKDKFLRKVPWWKIIKAWNFSISSYKTYWFKYAISNNLFKEKENNYYGLQAYIFISKNKVYVINYLSTKEEKVDNFLKLIKQIKLEK